MRPLALEAFICLTQEQPTMDLHRWDTHDICQSRKELQWRAAQYGSSLVQEPSRASLRPHLENQLLHVGDTCTLFCMPASGYAFGRTPLYTFVFVHVLLVLNTKLFSPRLFESIGTTMEVSYLGNCCI